MPFCARTSRDESKVAQPATEVSPPATPPAATIPLGKRDLRWRNLPWRDLRWQQAGDGIEVDQLPGQFPRNAGQQAELADIEDITKFSVSL